MKKRVIKSTARRRRSPAAESRSLRSPVGGSRPIKGAQHHEIGGVMIDAVAAANGQVKRVVYPAGFRWSTHMKPVVGTDLCQHAHVGFLAKGEIGIRYADGCTKRFVAPQTISIEPGHDGWVEGNESAVVI